MLNGLYPTIELSNIRRLTFQYFRMVIKSYWNISSSFTNFFNSLSLENIGVSRAGIIFDFDECDYLIRGNKCKDAPCPYDKYVCCQYCDRMKRCDALCEILPQLDDW